MMADGSYNPNELMICTASRLMEDNSTVFIGTGLPMLAGALAQKMHAPNLVSIFEFGGWRYRRYPGRTSLGRR